MIRYVASLAILLSTAAVGQTTAPAPAVAIKPVKTSKLDPNAVRCIKTPIVGTLSQFTRTCMTNAEWARARTEVDRMRAPTSATINRP